MDIINAVTIPTKSIISSRFVKANPNFKSFSKLAPNITGIARKKVNSAAISLDVPRITAPKIVAPDLDVPGIKESTWKAPIKSAVL